MNKLYLKDNEYEYNGYDELRRVVRAILLNENGEVCLHHLFYDDIFGHRDYFETPGGGVNDGETLEEALRREIKEEVGVSVKNVKKIYKVIDFYNLIKRKNINYYFICEASSFCKKEQEDYEKKMIKETIWVPVEDAIKLYENMNDEKIARVVRNRELPVLKFVRTLI